MKGDLSCIQIHVGVGGSKKMFGPIVHKGIVLWIYPSLLSSYLNRPLALTGHETSFL